MKIHEYQAKEIFSKYGIPVERHTLCRTAAGVLAAYRRMGTDRVVIKAQVLTGGRGKAGGVKLVNNTEDAYQEAKNILGMSIIRELGPMLAAILVAGRSGSAITAQLGVMRVTEELDAMRVMGIPHGFRLIRQKQVKYILILFVSFNVIF